MIKNLALVILTLFLVGLLFNKPCNENKLRRKKRYLLYMVVDSSEQVCFSRKISLFSRRMSQFSRKLHHFSRRMIWFSRITGVFRDEWSFFREKCCILREELVDPREK